MKRLLVLFVAVSALAGGMILPAIADNHEGSVNASVTPLVVAISVSPGNIAYGTVELSASNETRSTDTSELITVMNTGSSSVNLAIRGSDATPGNGTDSTWTLNCSPSSSGTVGPSQFVHRFAVGSPPDFGGAGAALCLNSQTLFNGVAATGDIQFGLQINMPTATVGFSERSTTVTVIATAP